MVWALHRKPSEGLTMVADMLEGLDVLIVDENARDRSAARRILRAHGADRVTEVEEPLAALEIVRHRRPGLLITEHHLELVRFLRADRGSAIAEIPIVMVSGRHRQSDVQEAHGAGIDEFVAKPLSAKRLVAHVLRALHDRRPFIRSALYLGPDRRLAAESAEHADALRFEMNPILTSDEIRVLLRG